MSSMFVFSLGVDTESDRLSCRSAAFSNASVKPSNLRPLEDLYYNEVAASAHGLRIDALVVRLRASRHDVDAFHASQVLPTPGKSSQCRAGAVNQIKARQGQYTQS
jgi:hypothetical protein